MDREDIMVVVGGVILKKDYPFLLDQGVFGIYGPEQKSLLQLRKFYIYSYKVTNKLVNSAQ